MVYQTSDFRNGLKLEIDGDPYVIVYFQFVKPGKGTAFTRTKLKNLVTGAVIERTFRTGETVKAAECEEVDLQFQYADGDMYHFMDLESFEQVGIPASVLDGAEKYLTDNLEVKALKFRGRPVAVELPNFIEDVIEHCEPGVRGNTATGATKPARLACGAEIQVPLFIEEGEKVRVDTRTGKYVTRVR